VVDASSTVGLRLPPRRPAVGRVPGNHAPPRSGASGRTNLLAALLALIGVILPTEVQISLGAGARFTPGRVAAALLIIPSLVVLCQNGRRFLSCDFLAAAMATWMIVAGLSSVGISALSSAGGDALDFLGGYMIARAYFFGRPALDTFIRVLRNFAFIVIMLAVADNMSGRLIVHETIAAIVHASNWPQAGLRNNTVRAASTFDHAILFGVFCASTAAILLYWERGFLRRSFAVGVCLFGCILSQSSAALIAFSIALASFTYDRLMRRYAWRWNAFWMVIGASSLAFVAVSTNPLSWIISHLTLDPQTGYFRIMIWDAALSYIAQSPITGYAYELFNNNIVDGSVDSIWLLNSLRFGVPMFFLFFLTNVTAFLPVKRQFRYGADDTYMDAMRRAFTLVLSMLMFSGLTVHFWNYMWMFWGLCIGIRASLRESSIEMNG
jgi:O-Antigen ligase